MEATCLLPGLRRTTRTGSARSPEHLIRTQIPPLPDRQVAQHHATNAHPLEADHLQADGFARPPDLALPSLLMHAPQRIVEWLNDDQLRFVLQEGKKRQIRRMCEAVGLKVIGLKRVRIGRVMLGDLPVGQWRYLRADEVFG